MPRQVSENRDPEGSGRDEGGAVSMAAARRPGGDTGTDLAAELAELYRQDGPERIAAMRRALAESDAGILSRAAHALAGSALYLGASTLAARCRELEELADLGDFGACRSRFEAVEREHRRLLDELRTA